MSFRQENERCIHERIIFHSSRHRNDPVDQVEFFDSSIDLCIDLISFHEACMI